METGAPIEGDFSTINDLISGTTVWATYQVNGTGKYQGNEEAITVTVGYREH